MQLGECDIHTVNLTSHQYYNIACRIKVKKNIYFQIFQVIRGTINSKENIRKRCNISLINGENHGLVKSFEEVITDKIGPVVQCFTFILKGKCHEILLINTFQYPILIFCLLPLLFVLSLNSANGLTKFR